jgi:hypothetical protein
VSALKSLAAAKSEFETTTQYEERIRAAAPTQLIGTIRLEDKVAFRIPVDPQAIKYSADDATVAVRLPSNYYVYDRTDKRRLYHPLDPQQLSTSFYLASNAYGAKTKVRKTVGRVCGVAYDGLSTDYREEFSATGGDAQAFKAAPGLLLVGKMEPPFFFVGQDRKTATFDSPNERVIAVDAIHVAPLEMWFFNSQTGAVLHKTSVK